MVIFSIYQWVFASFVALVESLSWKHVLISGAVGAGIALVLFLLQGAGLYVMARRAGLKKKWLAFVPFASTFYLGKLAGETHLFGQKMKRAGLYAMLAQIVFALFMLAVLIVEAILFVQYKEYIVYNTDELTGMLTGISWANLPAEAQPMYTFYLISDYISGTLSLVQAVLVFLLVMTLYRKYAPKNYMLLSMLEIFVPASKAIVIFVLRNREPVDFEAYMRARRDAYMRRQGQYYGQNPYGGTYGSPYGQNPYAGQQPQRPTPPDEPFSEFGGTGTQGGDGKGSGSGGADEFFN